MLLTYELFYERKKNIPPPPPTHSKISRCLKFLPLAPPCGMVQLSASQNYECSNNLLSKYVNIDIYLSKKQKITFLTVLDFDLKPHPAPEALGPGVMMSMPTQLNSKFECFQNFVINSITMREGNTNGQTKGKMKTKYLWPQMKTAFFNAQFESALKG